MTDSLKISKLTLCLCIIGVSLFPLKSSAKPKELSMEQECAANNKYIVNPSYKGECYVNYHQYEPKNISSLRKQDNGNIQIATFNMLHPGQDKTIYKDYTMIAKIIKDWDIIAATEMQSLVSTNRDHNEALLELLEVYGPERLKELYNKRDSTENTTTKKYEKLLEDIAELENDMQEAKALYREPGYLLLLDALIKEDPKSGWSLILSSKPEAIPGVKGGELVGFYYKGTKLEPVGNEYCKSSYHHESPACIAQMKPPFMDKDYEDIFSRRPFIGSFKSGDFDFTLLAAHVVFEAPKTNTSVGKKRQKELLEKVFNVSNKEELSEKGYSTSKYARIAEIKLTLQFADSLRKNFNEQDIIYLGDFNMEANESYWPELLEEFPGATVLVTDATSLSEGKFRKSGGKLVDTNGYSSNYDHFILDQNNTHECYSNRETQAWRYDFYNSNITDEMKKRYIFRASVKSGDIYPISSSKQALINDKVEKYLEELLSLKTIKRNKVVAEFDPTKEEIDEINSIYEAYGDNLILNINGENKIFSKVKKEHPVLKKHETFALRYLGYKIRVFKSQQYDDTFYQVYKEILSDHMPIHMQCSTQEGDDD